MPWLVTLTARQFLVTLTESPVTLHAETCRVTGDWKLSVGVYVSDLVCLHDLCTPLSAGTGSGHAVPLMRRSGYNGWMYTLV